MTVIKQLVDKEDFTGYYLLKECELKQTNATPPKDYFDIVLSDKSGTISAKWWDISAADKETFAPMMLVKLKGITHIYRDKLQVKVQRVRKVTPEDGVSITDFVRTAPITSDNLVATIRNVTKEISNEQIQAMVTYCLDKVADKLAHYPAAKTHHHAYFGGLAYHTVRMLEIGRFVCHQRPFLNPDLIYAGIILHDIAKTAEMTAELGVVSEYSVQGKLIGHIALAANWITEAAIKLNIDVDSEVVVVLSHIVLAHHGLLEWGSPVQPQIAEAIALHLIDSLDAKLQMVEDALEATPERDQWTAMVRGLDNKAIYRTNL